MRDVTGVRVHPADDLESFEQYALARREGLVRAAFLLTGDVHAAQDIVQATLVRIWPRWRGLERDRNIDAYVHQTLYTVFVTAERRRRWREVLTDPGSAVFAHRRDDDGSVSVVESLALEQFIQALPPRQRAVVVLRYYLDLSEADTAAALGCAIGTAKSQHSKAMRRLRSLIATNPEN
jgi:RNA polymerase sigma-70 factor (sigma-E family)